MNSKVVAAVVAVAIILAAAVCVWQFSGSGSEKNETGDSITVTDSSGREVTVPLPVERVAICDTSLVEIFAMSVGDDWADYVCLLPQDMETREPAKWQRILEDHPELADVPRCPDIFSAGASGFPAQDIIESDPDLVLLPGATVNYYPGIDQQVAGLESSGMGVLYLEFYDKSFTEGIAEENYGVLGEIMGTSDVADRVVDFYNEKLAYVQDRLASAGDRDFTFYVEIPAADPDTYGAVVAMGCPEFTILGGTNVCTDPAGADYNWNLEKMQEPDGDGPDYIVLVSSGYYGADAILGYGCDPTDEECEAEIGKYLDRAGWSDLGAVRDGNVIMCYGELRNSAFGLVDLYSVGSVIYPDLISQQDVDDLIAGLDELCPFGFEGTWMYHAGA